MLVRSGSGRGVLREAQTDQQGASGGQQLDPVTPVRLECRQRVRYPQALYGESSNAVLWLEQETAQLSNTLKGIHRRSSGYACGRNAVAAIEHSDANVLDDHNDLGKGSTSSQ